jgi:hypothetical protein
VEERRSDLADRRRRPKLPPPGLDLPREERLRRKPRDPDEDEALTRLILAKRDLYLRAGKLELTGPRQRRLHLGQERIVEYLRQQSS